MHEGIEWNVMTVCVAVRTTENMRWISIRRVQIRTGCLTVLVTDKSSNKMRILLRKEEEEGIWSSLILYWRRRLLIGCHFRLLLSLLEQITTINFSIYFSACSFHSCDTRYNKWKLTFMASELTQRVYDSVLLKLVVTQRNKSIYDDHKNCSRFIHFLEIEFIMN